MILPMMGLVFGLFVAGVIGGGILYVVRSLRRFSPYPLVPIIAAVGALASSWLLAIALERIFNAAAGGIGFLGGYALGGLLGAFSGFRMASRLAGALRRR